MKLPAAGRDRTDRDKIRAGCPHARPDRAARLQTARGTLPRAQEPEKHGNDSAPQPDTYTNQP